MAGLVNVDAGGIAKGLFNLIDELFTSDEERADAKRRLVELEQKGRLAQIGLNAKEAMHESIFVAGWRPFVGWTCGTALAWNYVVRPMTIAGLNIHAQITGGPLFDPTLLPPLDLTTMLPVLLGMLGLGGMRSFEKKHGVNKNR